MQIGKQNTTRVAANRLAFLRVNVFESTQSYFVAYHLKIAATSIPLQVSSCCRHGFESHS